MFLKSHKKFFITILVVTLIIVSSKYINLLHRYNWQQSIADNNFTSSLSVAYTFGSNLIYDEKFKNYYYNDAMSKIEAAAQLFQFTTYNKSNNGLSVTLYTLSTTMKDFEYKDSILEKSYLIYENLSKIAQNPADLQATSNLDKLITDIRERE